MKRNRIIRNQRIKAAYKDMYDKEGLRNDVICKRLGDRWCLSPDYIADIIRMDLPELPPKDQGELFPETD